MSWAIFKTLRRVDTLLNEATAKQMVYIVLHNTENHLRNNLCKKEKEALAPVAFEKRTFISMNSWQNNSFQPNKKIYIGTHHHICYFFMYFLYNCFRL